MRKKQINFQKGIDKRKLCDRINVQQTSNVGCDNNRRDSSGNNAWIISVDRPRMKSRREICKRPEPSKARESESLSESEGKRKCSAAKRKQKQSGSCKQTFFTADAKRKRTIHWAEKCESTENVSELWRNGVIINICSELNFKHILYGQSKCRTLHCIS